MARGYRMCSCTSTRAASVSSVSLSFTGTAACRMIGPLSMPSSTKWIVQPDTFTPYASTSRCACAPPNDGRSDGWIFMMRPANSRTKYGLRIRMKPARITSVTPCSLSFAASFSSNSCFVAQALRSTQKCGMPAFSALSSAFASGLSVSTTPISAGICPLSTAAMIDCRFVPRPEQSTPRTALLIENAAFDGHSMLALDDPADRIVFLPGRFQRPGDLPGLRRRRDDHHADAHIERAVHFLPVDTAPLLQQLKNRRTEPGRRVNLDAHILRQRTRNIIVETAACDVCHAVD